MVKHSDNERLDRSPEGKEKKGKSLRVKRDDHSSDRDRSPTRRRREESRHSDGRDRRRSLDTNRGRSGDNRHSSRHGNRSSYGFYGRDGGEQAIKIKQEVMSDEERGATGILAAGNSSPFRKQKNRRVNSREEDANFEYGLQVKEEKEDKPPVEKQKPNFGLSGKLAEEKNMFNGVVVKYSEPPEARIPKRRWRFYVFKGEENMPTLYLHRQSAYLLGRDRKVADIPVDHPSCSKQHAVLQFRLVNYERPDGSAGRTVRPYIIDLESANGTYVNNQKVEPKRYIELFEKDVIKFGFSSREYVLLHEESKSEAGMDDMGQ